MSEHPDIGEIVDFYLTEKDTVGAVVTAVFFWDHIHVRLIDSGDVILDVRVALAWDIEGWTNVGRFKRRAPNNR